MADSGIAQAIAACSQQYSNVVQPFDKRVYDCVWDLVCDGNSTRTDIPSFDPVTMLPFEDYCGLKDCYSVPLTDLNQPCYRYRCVENNPLYKQYTWCGFYPTDPKKLILPLVLIFLLCSIVFYMAFASCRERAQRIKYLKAQNYGKLRNSNNRH